MIRQVKVCDERPVNLNGDIIYVFPKSDSACATAFLILVC